MSFGDKRLDAAYDRWATQTPEEYYGVEDDEDEESEDKQEKKKEKKK